MTIYLVVLLAVLNQAAFNGSRVAVSLLALELGATQFTVGVLIALYSVCTMLFSIAIGRISDRVPPRLPMIVGSVMTVVGLVLPALVPQLAALYLAALLLGLGHQVFNIPLEAVVGGVGGPQHRARNYALITMGWSVANFIGPLVTGLSIDTIGHRHAFWVLGALAAVPIAIMGFMPRLLPQSISVAQSDKSGGVLDLWRIPQLRATFVAGAIIGSAQDLFQFYMPVYGHAVGLSASAIGTVLGMVALAAFVIRASIPILVKRVGEARILVSAIFVSAVAYVLLPLFQTAAPLAATAFLLGLGVGCAQPMLMSLLYVLAPAGRIAEAIGLYKTLRSVTHIVIPVFFGSVGTAFGFATVFLSNAGILAFGGVLQQRSFAAAPVRKSG